MFFQWNLHVLFVLIGVVSNMCLKGFVFVSTACGSNFFFRSNPLTKRIWFLPKDPCSCQKIPAFDKKVLPWKEKEKEKGRKRRRNK